jgi:hypothetical protein
MHQRFVSYTADPPAPEEEEAQGEEAAGTDAGGKISYVCAAQNAFKVMSHTNAYITETNRIHLALFGMQNRTSVLQPL